MSTDVLNVLRKQAGDALEAALGPGGKGHTKSERQGSPRAQTQEQGSNDGLWTR